MNRFIRRNITAGFLSIALILSGAAGCTIDDGDDAENSGGGGGGRTIYVGPDSSDASDEAEEAKGQIIDALCLAAERCHHSYSECVREIETGTGLHFNPTGLANESTLTSCLSELEEVCDEEGEPLVIDLDEEAACSQIIMFGEGGES